MGKPAKANCSSRDRRGKKNRYTTQKETWEGGEKSKDNTPHPRSSKNKVTKQNEKELRKVTRETKGK